MNIVFFSYRRDRDLLQYSSCSFSKFFLFQTTKIPCCSYRRDLLRYPSSSFSKFFSLLDNNKNTMLFLQTGLHSIFYFHFVQVFQKANIIPWFSYKWDGLQYPQINMFSVWHSAFNFPWHWNMLSFVIAFLLFFKYQNNDLLIKSTVINL